MLPAAVAASQITELNRTELNDDLNAAPAARGAQMTAGVAGVAGGRGLGQSCGTGTHINRL